MLPFIHDFTSALKSEPLRVAFEKRKGEASAALAHWRQSSDKNILALRHSLTRTDDLDAAQSIVAHLSKDSSDVIILGIGGSSLGAQALTQLAYWGTPAYAPPVGHPRLRFPTSRWRSAIA